MEYRSKRLTAACRAGNSPAVGLFFVPDQRRGGGTVTGHVVEVRPVRPPASSRGTIGTGAIARQRPGATITGQSTRQRTQVSTACGGEGGVRTNTPGMQSRGQR